MLSNKGMVKAEKEERGEERHNTKMHTHIHELIDGHINMLNYVLMNYGSNLKPIMSVLRNRIANF